MPDTTVVEMNEQGRVVIPAAIRKQLNLVPGSRLSVLLREGAVVLVPQDAIRARLHGMFAGMAHSMADELMAERRREAAEE